ncbi:MAG: hypothetical protein JKY53_10910 [Flavobacteriales bacterium]|nr:hypothetical protein [Flavobacteriales bacterium]
MSLELQLSQLPTFYNRVDIIQQTAEQTIKDFDVFDYQITFSETEKTAYEELFDQILPLIGNLVINDYKKLMNILYRIDVNEDLIDQKLSTSNPTQFAEIITELVLERELKKVVIRNYYKNQQNET